MGRCMCKKLVSSVSTTVVGTSLVVNIPQAAYDNCQQLCLFIAQPITGTPTRGMPVVITIGTGATQYPLVKCNGSPVTQEFIAEGRIYPLVVQTTATSAVFRSLEKLCNVSTNLPAIPVPEADTPAGG